MLLAATTTDMDFDTHPGEADSGREADHAATRQHAELLDLLALLQEDIRLGAGQLSRDLREVAGEASRLERAVVDLDEAGHALVTHAVARTAALPLLDALRRRLDRHLRVVESLGDAPGERQQAAAEAKELGPLVTSVLAEIEAALAPQAAQTEALARIIETAALRPRPDERASVQIDATRRRLQRFEARLLLALRPPWSGERRREPRLPVRITASLQCGERRWSGETVDLARGGALLVLETTFERPPIGGCARLELADLGLFSARIVALSAKGVHLAFAELTPQLQSVLDGRLAALVALDAPFVNLARWAAREVEALFARGVAAGEITDAALFASPAALHVAGPDEIAADAALAATARDFLRPRLAGLQAQIAACREEILYATCCDRHGYLAAVTAGPAAARDGAASDDEASAPVLRSDSLDDSFHGIQAARSRDDHIACMPTAARREIAVPITVGGRHWGAFRVGFRPAGISRARTLPAASTTRSSRGTQGG